MSTIYVDGEVDSPRSFSFEALAALPDQVDDVGALVPGRTGAGVRMRALLAAVGARGRWLTLESADGFSISVPLEPEVEQGVIAFRAAAAGAAPLSDKQGGPARFFVVGAVECKTGTVDACANVKHLRAIHVTREKAPDTHTH